MLFLSAHCKAFGKTNFNNYDMYHIKNHVWHSFRLYFGFSQGIHSIPFFLQKPRIVSSRFNFLLLLLFNLRKKNVLFVFLIGAFFVGTQHRSQFQWIFKFYSSIRIGFLCSANRLLDFHQQWMKSIDRPCILTLLTLMYASSILSLTLYCVVCLEWECKFLVII